ncbi:MAG TPA: hypothetical protein VIJ66_04190, partial [Solirubrobacteraceae bacterium]
MKAIARTAAAVRPRLGDRSRGPYVLDCAFDAKRKPDSKLLGCFAGMPMPMESHVERAPQRFCFAQQRKRWSAPSRLLLLAKAGGR